MQFKTCRRAVWINAPSSGFRLAKDGATIVGTKSFSLSISGSKPGSAARNVSSSSAKRGGHASPHSKASPLSSTSGIIVSEPVKWAHPALSRKREPVSRQINQTLIGGVFMRGISALAFLLLHSLAVYGQSTASLRGVIADPSGASVPEAVVTLTNVATGFKRQVVTGADGVYQFLQTPPGAYQVSVERPGFATATHASVQLLVNTPATLDLQMSVGARTESVSVIAEAAAINTVDASIGDAFFRAAGPATAAGHPKRRRTEPAGFYSSFRSERVQRY